MRIAFVGVHGVGKSTLAKAIAKELGIGFVELECIEEARLLPPKYRQIMFLTSFTYTFLKFFSKYESLAYSSHPIMVPIYTEFWVGTNDAKWMYDFVLKLPKVDIIYVLHAPIKVVQARLLKRRRVVLKEELDPTYIDFIQRRTLSLLDTYYKLAREVEILNTDDTINNLVRKIVSSISSYNKLITARYT